MKVKQKLKDNRIVLSIRLQSAIEVHLFNKATFTHSEYSTEFSDWCDDESNMNKHMFGETLDSNLSIHKSGDIVFTPFFGIILKGWVNTNNKCDEEGTYEEVQRSIDNFIDYLRRAMGV